MKVEIIAIGDELTWQDLNTTSSMPLGSLWGPRDLCHAHFGVRPDQRGPEKAISQVDAVTSPAVSLMRRRLTKAVRRPNRPTAEPRIGSASPSRRICPSQPAGELAGAEGAESSARSRGCRLS
jgi:hypothetical protein